MNTRVELDSDDVAIIVAENLCKLREFHSLSQREMAEKLRTNQAGYCLSEKGLRELSMSNLYYLGVEFGISINGLFGLSDERFNPQANAKHIDNLSKKDNRRRQWGGRTKKK